MLTLACILRRTMLSQLAHSMHSTLTKGNARHMFCERNPTMERADDTGRFVSKVKGLRQHAAACFSISETVQWMEQYRPRPTGVSRSHAPYYHPRSASRVVLFSVVSIFL